MADLEVEELAGAVRIRVRVKPRASKSRVLPIREAALEVAVAAPPVGRRGEAELIRTLAAALARTKSEIEIVSGEGSRSKLLAIAGLTAAELLAKLGLMGIRGREG